jgi:hypothetical protein
VKEKGHGSQFKILFEIVEFYLKENYSVEISGGVTVKSRLLNDQNDSIISEIFAEVLQVEKWAKNKADQKSLIFLYGNDMMMESIDTLFFALQ